MPLVASCQRALYRCQSWYMFVLRAALQCTKFTRKLCQRDHNPICPTSKVNPSQYYSTKTLTLTQGAAQIDKSIIYLQKPTNSFLMNHTTHADECGKTSEWRRYKKRRKCQRTDKKSSDIHKFHCDIINVSDIHRRVIASSACITRCKCSMRAEPSA